METPMTKISRMVDGLLPNIGKVEKHDDFIILTFDMVKEIEKSSIDFARERAVAVREVLIKLTQIKPENVELSDDGYSLIVRIDKHDHADWHWGYLGTTVKNICEEIRKQDRY